MSARQCPPPPPPAHVARSGQLSDQSCGRVQLRVRAIDRGSGLQCGFCVPLHHQAQRRQRQDAAVQHRDPGTRRSWCIIHFRPITLIKLVCLLLAQPATHVGASFRGPDDRHRAHSSRTIYNLKQLFSTNDEA